MLQTHMFLQVESGLTWLSKVFLVTTDVVEENSIILPVSCQRARTKLRPLWAAISSTPTLLVVSTDRMRSPLDGAPNISAGDYLYN